MSWGWSRRKDEFCIQNLYLGEVFISPLGLQGVLGDWVLSLKHPEAHEQRYTQQVIEWQGLWFRREDRGANSYGSPYRYWVRHTCEAGDS